MSRPFVMVGVWAHPDDETYLSAALMHRVAGRGGQVQVISATRGELGAPEPGPDAAVLARRREHELRRAMAELGVHDVRFLGHRDGACADADPGPVVEQLATALRAVRPDLVVTFGPDGITGHPDHIAVGRWVTLAWQGLAEAERGRLLYATMTDDFVARHRRLHPELPLTLEGEPVSIPDHDVALRVEPDRHEREAKRAALLSHESQTGPLIDLLGEDRFVDWWTTETFRDPTPAELDTATTWPGTESFDLASR